MLLLQEDLGFFARLGTNEYVTRNPILHVHQLENIYSDLTGQILPSNLDELDQLNELN